MYKIALLVNQFQKERVFNSGHIEKMSQLGDLHVYDREDFSDKEYVLGFVENSDVIITSWNSPQLSSEILARCPELKAVIHAAGSVKKFLSPELTERNIRVTTSANEVSRGVAETTLALAIGACKGFFTLPDDTRKGMWRENFNNITDFYGIKIGIIGAGNAGRHLIRLLQGFCVEIVVYDPTLSSEEIESLGAQKRSLNELLSECDVVSVHAPSIPETENMLNEETLSLMRDGAVLINTARATIIDEDALIKVCAEKNIFAIIDVMRREPPPPDHSFRKAGNIVLLPHIAGVTTNGVKRIGKYVCEELERFVCGKPMECEIDLAKISIMA